MNPQEGDHDGQRDSDRPEQEQPGLPRETGDHGVPFVFGGFRLVGFRSAIAPSFLLPLTG